MSEPMQCDEAVERLSRFAGGESLRTLYVLPRGRFDPARRDVAALLSRLAQAEAALKPFADAAADLEGREKDGQDVWEHSAAMSITVGDLRRAAHVLTNGGE